MPLHSLVSDPYEDITVYVKPSPILNAQEGLFALRRIPKGDLCSIYSGCLVTLEEEESRAWKYNSNTIQLDEDYCVDVPHPYESTSLYKASLGHKANHGFGAQVNSEYMELFHP